MMTPQQLKETLTKAEEQLLKAESIYRDCLLVVARLRSMSDLLFMQTGNKEYVTQ
jgi:hypothetical protein